VKAHFEPVVGIVRVFEDHKSFGDDYVWSATVVLDGDKAKLCAAMRAPTSAEWAAVQRCLIEAGATTCSFDRGKSGRHSLPITYKLQESDMGEKYWNSEIEFKIMDSTEFPGRARTEITVLLLGEDNKPRSGAAPLFFDDLDPEEAKTFVGGVFADSLPGLAKFGYVHDGNKLRATSIPDGRTRRIAEFLWEHGIRRFISLGDDRAKKKGRSSKDDFDGDGKHKEKKNK
jgi:hypothetical protein